jgi:hypothetical protein
MRVPVSGRRFHPAESQEMRAVREAHRQERERRRELEERLTRSDAGAAFVDRIKRIGRSR